MSGMNLAALDKALAAQGKRDEVYALLTPEARAAFQSPHSSRWHPGRFGVEAWLAIVKLGGKQWLEDLNYELTRKSFGPIVKPLVKIALTLSGSSPASVFARLGDATSVALKHVKFEWKAQSPQAGSLTVSYPCAMPPEVVEPGWRGVVRVGAEMTEKTINVDRFEPENDRRFRFDVSW